MQTFKPPDTHHLSSAIGWLELGNAREARHELAKLSPETANHPEVLELRWSAAVDQKDWADAAQVAESLWRLDPASASSWLHRAYAIRRAEGGGLSAAWDALLPAAERFPSEPIIPYNLACYACQMGRLEEARQWLRRARKLGDPAWLKSMALADEDLKPIRPEVAEW
jgi:uncharacterized protein HemY